MKIFYWSLRSVARIVLQIYFKKVILQGEDKIDLEKPMLIAVNHPNSFLEACVLACWLKFPLHFIVRGDVFHPAFRWFFKWTNQIPIYRFRDGFSKMRDNVDTFIHCYEKLNEGEKIIIFCEGGTKWTKQLRPIQRGTGKIAKGAMNANPDLELQILPIGINYEDVFKFRSTIEIKVAAPIDVPPLMNVDKPVNTITSLLSDRLSDCVVHLDDEQDIPLFDIIAEVKGIYDIGKRSKLSLQFQIAAAMNKDLISEEKKRECQELIEVKSNLKLNSLSPSHRKSPPVFMLYVWWPFHFLISIILLFPAWMARVTARKVYAHPAFVVPIRLGFNLIYYIAYYIVLFVLSFIFLSIKQSLIVIFILFAMAAIYPYSFEKIERWKDQVKWKRSNLYPTRNTYIERIENISL